MITIDELKKKQTTKTRLIGLDLGSKRIGVAISDENQKIATPFKTLQNNGLKNLISDLSVIIDENKIGGIIIGNPINMDGSFGKAFPNDPSILIGFPIIIPPILFSSIITDKSEIKFLSPLFCNVLNGVAIF